MKAEKEPEEFEFGCEDLTKDWFDEISDMEEPEEKIKCDENDFFDNEQDSVEPDSKPDKARTGGPQKANGWITRFPSLKKSFRNRLRKIMFLL